MTNMNVNLSRGFDWFYPRRENFLLRGLDVVEVSEGTVDK
jgi:hypothetical protein